MTKAVIEETWTEMREAFLETMQELSELLAIALEECCEDEVKYEKIDASNSEEVLGTLSAFTLLHELQDDDILLRTLGFADTAQAARMYRKLHGPQRQVPSQRRSAPCRSQ